MNKIVIFGLRLWTVFLLAAIAGCGRTGSPMFVSNMVAMNQAQITAPQRQDIVNILDAMFGTPDKPFVLSETGLDIKKIQTAAGPVHSDEFGRETGLYRRHCAHCHGTTGDGMGPTAMILNPYPRDYRQGKFKFKSTERPDKPTEADLDRIVRYGVQGTAMPAFGLLPDAQIKSLVEYVKYLSLRGQTELRLIAETADLSTDEPTLKISRETLVDGILAELSETWKTASEKIVNPVPKPEIELAKSVEAGRELFYGTKGNCAKCHGWSAQGDGQTNEYDDWNKPIAELIKGINSDRETLRASTELTSEQRSEISRRIATATAIVDSDALPVRPAIPRNLRQNIYRGGRRPLDIYRRLYTGINGTPMPAVGPASPGAQGTLSNDEIWSLVDYVLSLPYESLSQPPRPRAVQEARLFDVQQFHE